MSSKPRITLGDLVEAVYEACREELEDEELVPIVAELVLGRLLQAQHQQRDERAA